MRKGEDNPNEIVFSGADGINSPEFIQALRIRGISEGKAEDPKYMASLASVSFTGPALVWFENLADDVQTDWALLRRALLARFPVLDADLGEIETLSLKFSGGGPQECEDFVQSVRKHSYAEGKSRDDQWIAGYAASSMAGEALRWHAKLDASTRDNWTRLERALLSYSPERPPHGLTPPGRVLVERWERTEAPTFIPRDEPTWLREARERRVAYEQASPGERPSVYWLLVEKGESIPDAAIQTGIDTDGDLLYCARAWLAGGLWPGKCGRHLSGAQIPIDVRDIIDIAPYEVLVGDPSAVCWVANPWTGHPSMTGKNPPPTQMKPFHAIEGGFYENDGPLLLAQAYIEGRGWQPGVIGPCWMTCGTVLDQKVFYQTECRILVWA